MSSMQIKKIFGQYKILALLIAIVIIWAFFFVMTDGSFMTPRNFSNLLRQMATTGVLACGMVFVIIAGEIDLSVGSLLGLLGGIAALLDVTYGVPLYLNLLIVAGLGLMVGVFNGYWVAYMKVPSFIVGLAGMLAFRGIVLGLTGGVTIAPLSNDFAMIGKGYLPSSLGIAIAVILFAFLVFLIWQQRRNRIRYKLPVPAIQRDVLKALIFGLIIVGFVSMLEDYEGIPIPVLILLALLGIFSYVATQTVFGRRIYAVGSNMEATRLSGVNVQRVKLMVFAVMGTMCALASMIETARLAAGSPSAGTSAELSAIAACFIGGTSMRGGSGTVHGALIGALVMASLDNGMSMMGIEAFWQMIVMGSILLLAVWVDVISRTDAR